MMMGVWLATSFIGNFGADYPGNFWSSKMKPSFFLMIAGVALVRGRGHLGLQSAAPIALRRGA